MFKRKDREYVEQTARDRSDLPAEAPLDGREPMPVRESDRMVERRSDDGAGVMREQRVERYTDGTTTPDVAVARETVETPVYRERTIDRPAYDAESVTTESRGYWFDSLATRVNSALFAVLLALEALLGLRFVLAAYAANRTSGFVDGVYNISHPFVRPFESAFTNRTWSQGIVEMNTLLAMGVYLLGFMLLAFLINALLPRYDGGGTETRRTMRHA